MEKEWTYGKWEGRICIWFLLEFVSCVCTRWGVLTLFLPKPPGRILADWSSFSYKLMTKKMIFYGNTAWPMSMFSSKEK